MMFLQGAERRHVMQEAPRVNANGADPVLRMALIGKGLAMRLAQAFSSFFW